MTMTDPIADFLTRIRNGQQANAKVIKSPYSRARKGVADVLLDEGYIRNVTVDTNDKGFQELTVELKYVGGKPVIERIQRVSKPGRRVYSEIKTLLPVSNGLGMSILSTSKGIVSDHNARKLGVGGEVLCQVF
ncbi:MAG: 30S ribosomal protein S8 [Alphaproteobacteria bacterium]|nr:30S ribosomal protein S8 [Alphaproteobacteria bacterium]